MSHLLESTYALRSKRKGIYPSLLAVRFIRKMPGGSQSILVVCDDSNYYVVKMAGNPQGKNTLANEILGQQLTRAIGLPVANLVFVLLTPSFIEAMAPDGWFASRTGPTPPEPGIHLGCQFIGWPDGESRTSDFIGKRQVGAITNRADFLGMLILDVWADHQDRRQAVFYSDSRPGPLRAVFIDHGMMFGGRRCVFEDDKLRPLYFDNDVYRGLWTNCDVGRWKARLGQIAPKVLHKSYNFIPSSWYDDQHRSMRAELLARLSFLDRLLEPYAEQLSR